MAAGASYIGTDTESLENKLAITYQSLGSKLAIRTYVCSLCTELQSGGPAAPFDTHPRPAMESCRGGDLERRVPPRRRRQGVPKNRGRTDVSSCAVNHLPDSISRFTLKMNGPTSATVNDAESACQHAVCALATTLIILDQSTLTSGELDLLLDVDHVRTSFSTMSSVRACDVCSLS